MCRLKRPLGSPALLSALGPRIWSEVMKLGRGAFKNATMILTKLFSLGIIHLSAFYLKPMFLKMDSASVFR